MDLIIAIWGNSRVNNSEIPITKYELLDCKYLPYILAYKTTLRVKKGSGYFAVDGNLPLESILP